MRKPVRLAALVAAVLSFSGSATAATGSAITIGHAPIGSLDPAVAANSSTDTEVLNQMFVGLMRFDVRTRQLELGLAKSFIASPDLKTWLFQLRPARWSDGQPITADDEVFAIQRARDPSAGGEGQLVSSLIASATALDKRTVVFQLTRPASYFPAFLANPETWPVPQHTIAAFGSAWTDPANIVVSGAYTLASHSATSVVLQGNTRYFNGAPSITQVTYVSGDPATLANEYAAGAIDYATADPLGGSLAVESDSRLAPDVVAVPDQFTEMLVFNPAVGATTNRDVRAALSAATDRASIAAAATGNPSFPGTTFTPPPIFGSVPASAGVGIGFDPSAALADKAAAGSAFPTSVTIRYSQGNQRRQIEAGILKTDWEQIFGPGFTVNLDPEPAPIAIGSLSNPDPTQQADVTMVAWLGDYPDADDFVNGGVRAVQMRWTDPAFDGATADAAATQDPTQRQSDYATAERIVTDTDAVVAPVYYKPDAYVHKPYLNVVGTRIENWTLTP